MSRDRARTQLDQPACNKARKSRVVVAEFSVAPFSLEPGSPWLGLIEMLAEAVVDEMMKEGRQRTVAAADIAITTVRPSPKAR